MSPAFALAGTGGTRHSPGQGGKEPTMPKKQPPKEYGSYWQNHIAGGAKAKKSAAKPAAKKPAKGD